MPEEQTPLIISSSKLSFLLTIICIVDVFGVFPVVTLPKAVIDCGFYGIFVILLVCLVQVYTAMLLGRCWLIAEEIEPKIVRKNRYPYSALVQFVFDGYGLANLVSFLLNLTVFSGGIPNLIVASQNLQLLGVRIGGFDLSFCFWIILIGIGLCPILWLGSPKDMKALIVSNLQFNRILCTISVVMVALVFLLVTGCLIAAPSRGAEVVPQPADRPFWELILTVFGIISFQYDIHPSILTIQVDMKQKQQLGRAIITAFSISLAMFAIVAILSTSRFDSTALQPSVLETLPNSIPLYFAALFVAIQLCLTSSINNNALYQQLEDCMQISRHFNHRRCVLRTLLILFAILIAEMVPRFDLVMSLIGGTLTAPLVFILPPVIYLKMLRKRDNYEKELMLQSFGSILDRNRRESIGEMFPKRNWEKIEAVLCVFIIVVSVCCTIATTFINVRNMVRFVQFTQPCIYNVSIAVLEF